MSLSVVDHSSGTGTAAAASRVVMMSRGTGHAFMSVPDRGARRTMLTLMGMRVVVGQLGRTSATKISLIPDMRGLAGNALTGVGVEMRMLSIAETFALGGVEGEARRAALTFLGVIVPMSVVRAALALLGGSVPVFRRLAGYTGSVVSQDRFVLRADALPGVSVEFKT